MCKFKIFKTNPKISKIRIAQVKIKEVSWKKVTKNTSPLDVGGKTELHQRIQTHKQIKTQKSFQIKRNDVRHSQIKRKNKKVKEKIYKKYYRIKQNVYLK